MTHALLTVVAGCCTAASLSGGLRDIATDWRRSGRGEGSGGSKTKGRGSWSSIGDSLPTGGDL